MQQVVSFDPDGAVVFNESSTDVDFRVESNNLTHALFVQGSDGNIGINSSAPVAPLTFHDKGTLSFNAGDFAVGNNLYYDSVSDRWERLTGNAGSAVYQTGGLISFYNTASGGATADAVTPTERIRIDNATFGIYAMTSNVERAGGMLNASSSTNSLRISADPDDDRSASRLEFYVDAGEAMRISASHQVLIGNYTAGHDDTGHKF